MSVHIVSATGEHASDAIEHIDSTTPASDVRSRLHTHLVDLGDLPAVISLFQDLARSLPRLDMLFLIAGIGVAPFGLTESGLGNHFGVNNVSQLAITDVLYPLLKKTAEEKQGQTEEERLSTRIVSESSELHRGAPSDVRFESLEEMAEDKGPMKLYGMSKLGK
jgi:NAD(P)-dependent dehydrogenase (short-subunit alcohol dehydrogenase family)